MEILILQIKCQIYLDFSHLLVIMVIIDFLTVLSFETNVGTFLDFIEKGQLSPQLPQS